MKKSLTQRILHPLRFSKRRADGTVRLVKDGYFSPKESWYSVQARILKRDGYQCRKMREVNGRLLRCSNDKSSGVPLHVHHIKELSRGGLTVDSNLLTLCEKCHDKRHAMSAWRNYR